MNPARSLGPGLVSGDLTSIWVYLLAPLIGAAVAHRLFPDARFVFAERDPRDAVLSCLVTRFALNPAMANFLTPRGKHGRR